MHLYDEFHVPDVLIVSVVHVKTVKTNSQGVLTLRGGGGVTAKYGLYRYVPR